MTQDAQPLIRHDDVPSVTPAGWGTLRRFTDARIALGRAGHSPQTKGRQDRVQEHRQNGPAGTRARETQR